MNLIKAYNEFNSVKVVAFAINFAKRLSAQEIEKLVMTFQKAEYFVSEFNKINEQQEISMTITPDGNPKPSKGMGGVLCNKFDAHDNMSWSLELNKDVVVIICHSYTRWKNISQKAYIHLEEVFKLLINYGCGISTITLEYLDEFAVLDKNKKWKEELFRINNKYLQENIYSLNDYWHVNHGYFQNLEGIENAKMLDTISVNYFADEEDNMQEKLKIRMQHKIHYSIVQEYNKSNLSDSYQLIHDHSKKIFETIISDSVLKTFDRGENL